MTNTYSTGNLSSSTVTVSGTASSGSGYTLTTGTGVSIPITTATTGSIGYNNWANINDKVMTIKPDPATLEVTGNVVINGVNLEERLKTIEQVLTIPERDVKLETKHPKLKKMYKDYITALAKYRTWEAIKGENND